MGYRTIKPSESVYQNFLAVAALLQATSAHNARYVVKDVYLDYGQDWMWTTICREGYNECQVLNPREWSEVVTASSIDDLCRVTKNIKAGRFFSDN